MRARLRPRLNRDLRADLDHAVGGELEIARRIVGIPRKNDEQPVLPARHVRARVGPYRAPRQEVDMMSKLNPSFRARASVFGIFGVSKNLSG